MPERIIPGGNEKKYSSAATELRTSRHAQILARAGSALRGLLAAERLSFARPLTTACGVGPKGGALKEHDYPNTCPRWLTARGGFLRCVWTIALTTVEMTLKTHRFKAFPLGERWHECERSEPSGE